MVDSIGSGKGIGGVRRPAAVAAPTSLRTSEMRRAAAANAVPNPAADLAAYGPPVDEARIAALRASIADGSYRVDPDQVAAKMIATDLPEATPATTPAAPAAPAATPAKAPTK